MEKVLDRKSEVGKRYDINKKEPIYLYPSIYLDTLLSEYKEEYISEDEVANGCKLFLSSLKAYREEMDLSIRRT